MKTMFVNAIMLFTVVSVAQVAKTAPSEQGWSESKIHAIIRAQVDQDRQSPGIVVGWIDKQGQVVVGHGRIGPENESRPNGKTVFDIGGVTSVFTAALLSDMVRQGRLNLDDPVQQFMPDSVRLPSKNDIPITLYHLITHTSGLPSRPSNLQSADLSNPYVGYSVQHLYDFLAQYKLPWEPGEKSQVSYLGVRLLGHALERATGENYESLVRKRIIEPLGMNDTVVTMTPALGQRLAQGHDTDLNPIPNRDMNMVTLPGAGALRSTVDDMLKYVAANLGLLDTPLRSVLEETHQTRESFGPEGTQRQIGLGWIISSQYGCVIHSKSGGTGGYNAFVGFDKERGRGAVVLSNSWNPIDDIGFHLLEPKNKLVNRKIAEPGTLVDEIPDSPAGAAFKNWMTYVNSDFSVDTCRAFYDKSFADSFKNKVPFENYQRGSEMIKGTISMVPVEQRRMYVHSDYKLTAYAKVGIMGIAIAIQVAPEPPYPIVGLSLRPGRPPEEKE